MEKNQEMVRFISQLDKPKKLKEEPVSYCDLLVNGRLATIIAVEGKTKLFWKKKVVTWAFWRFYKEPSYWESREESEYTEIQEPVSKVEHLPSNYIYCIEETKVGFYDRFTFYDENSWKFKQYIEET